MNQCLPKDKLATSDSLALVIWPIIIDWDHECCFNAASTLDMIPWGEIFFNQKLFELKIFSQNKNYLRRWANRSASLSKEGACFNFFMVLRGMYHHNHHVPGLLQTLAIMAFEPSLLSVLLMSSLLGDSFLVTKLFRLCILWVVFLCFWYHKSFHSIFVFLVHQLCLYAKKINCICLFLMVLSRDLLYPAISITSSFDFFSVHDILIILLIYHISAASGLLSRSFVNVQHSHPYRRMDHM